MEITESQYECIADCLPLQRGNVSLPNLQVLNAILYVAGHGCKWRGLPARFGKWHTIYTRMSRWSKAGVLERVFERLQREQIIRIRIEAMPPGSTGAEQKMARAPSEKAGEDGAPKFIWLPRMTSAL